MTVYLHGKSPYWHYDFQVRGQRFHGSTHCTSKSAAKEFERKERNRIAEGRQEKPDMTMDDAFGHYWALVGQHESNASTTKGQAKRLLAFFGKTTIIRDLDRAEVDKYIARRRGQKARYKQSLVSNATVNREVELLKRVLRRVPDRYARPNIDWKGASLREQQERKRELLPEEESRLFEALPPDLANVAEFAMLSGQRLGSIIGMLWSKLDLANHRATVRVKGDQWHTFPLSPRMVALVANQPKVCAQVFTYRCERPAPKKGNQPRRLKGERYPFSQDGWRRRWKKALGSAGVTDFRFHDLRHTAGTRVNRSSRNLKAVQELLGHSNISTTARYAHATEGDVRDALISTESRNSPEPGNADIEENGRKARDKA